MSDRDKSFDRAEHKAWLNGLDVRQRLEYLRHFGDQWRGGKDEAHCALRARAAVEKKARKAP